MTKIYIGILTLIYISQFFFLFNLVSDENKVAKEDFGQFFSLANNLKNA